MASSTTANAPAFSSCVACSMTFAAASPRPCTFSPPNP